MKNQGCGCSRIPFSLMIVILGGGYWWLISQGNFTKISSRLPDLQRGNILAIISPKSSSNGKSASLPAPDAIAVPTNPTTIKIESQSSPQPVKSAQPATTVKKAIRGIYLSRYQVTNNATEQTIRQRVRYYHDRGINTIIHGVWGNGCTMYRSTVMQQMVGSPSCPNQFADRWLEWTIDEAHQQGMQVHAYFEKGIKIDKNSPIFDLAIGDILHTSSEYTMTWASLQPD